MKAAQAKLHKPQPSAPALRVLVIDDDDVAREVMIDLLAEQGHVVSGLPSPIGATKHITDHQVEVVVLDVMMPSMRGDKLAALLSRNPKLQHVGVVLVTGARVEDMSVWAGSVGSAAIVSKQEIQADLPQAVLRAGRVAR